MNDKNTLRNSYRGVHGFRLYGDGRPTRAVTMERVGRNRRRGRIRQRIWV